MIVAGIIKGVLWIVIVAILIGLFRRPPDDRSGLSIVVL